MRRFQLNHHRLFKSPASRTIAHASRAGVGPLERRSLLSTVYVSDLTWASATNGSGPVERDTSNGANTAGDGRALTIGTTAYSKGLGVHARSEIVYNLAGLYSDFQTTVAATRNDSRGSRRGLSPADLCRIFAAIKSIVV